MPAYDTISFHPPAPIAFVTIRSSVSGIEVTNVPMMLDSGADITLLPRAAMTEFTNVTTTSQTYELEAFDGTRSLAAAVEMELQFLNKSFRGQFLLSDGNYGILGRNILNNLKLLLDGPALTWIEQR